MIIAVGSDAQWRACANALELTDLAEVGHRSRWAGGRHCYGSASFVVLRTWRLERQ